jgi:hypothetical protein
MKVNRKAEFSSEINFWGFQLEPALSEKAPVSSPFSLFSALLDFGFDFAKVELYVLTLYLIA